MNNELHKKLVLASVVVLLGGCAPMSPMPLVFVSTQTFGVDLGSDPSSAQTPRLVLGYKSNDVALVPVTTEHGQGNPIRGCYNTVKNMNNVTACADVVGGQGGEAASGQGKPPAGKESPASKTALHVAQFGGGTLAIPLDDANRKKPVQKPAQKPATTGGAGGKALPEDEGTSSSYGQSMRDSLSVFSSFNADTKVGAEGGVQLGKAFATGVAAQQLTEGINYYMQRKGQALASATTSETNKELILRTDCAKSLLAAKEKNVPNELLPNCNERSQQTQDELKAKTACVTALTAAVEKKVPEDKLPKCS